MHSMYTALNYSSTGSTNYVKELYGKAASLASKGTAFILDASQEWPTLS